MTNPYTFTDNPMISGVSVCNTDIVNDNLMYLKYAVDHIDTSDKADVDLSNLTDTGNIAMANASMPSDTYDDLTLGASGSTYTAPADGWFWLNGRITNNGGGLDLINNTSGFANDVKTVANAVVSAMLPVKKNDIVYVGYSTLVSPGGTLRFYYAKGAESEAN